MTKFFLALIAISIATLIGAVVVVAFRPHNPLLHRPQTSREALGTSGTLNSPSENGTVGLTSEAFLAGRGLSCDFGQSR